MPRRAGDSDFQGRTFWNKRCWGLILEEEGSHADDERMQKTEKRNSRQRFSRREGKEERAAPAARAGSLQEVRFRKERKCGGRAVGRGGRKLRRRQVTADGQQPGESLRKTAEHRGMWNVPWLRDDEFWARTVHGQPSAFGNTLSGSEHRVLNGGLPRFKGRGLVGQPTVPPNVQPPLCCVGRFFSGRL